MIITTLIPGNFEPTGKHSDKLAIVADHLLRMTACMRQRIDGDWMPYGRKEWRRTVGSDYGPIRNAAINQGLIESNDRYSPGRFAKSIRLRDEHRTGEFSEYPLRRRSIDRRPRHPSDFADEVSGWLAGWFDDFVLPALNEFDSPWHRFAYTVIRMRRFSAGRCKHGRFHSSFTSLPKALRCRLLIDEPVLSSPNQTNPLICDRISNNLVELDIANCQPLLLGSLTENTRRDHHWRELTEAGELYGFIHRCLQSSQSAPFEVVTKRGRRFTVDPQSLTLKQVKRQVLVALYSPIESMRANPVFAVFNDHFPAIATELMNRKQSAGYRSVSHDLQRHESGLMIDGVADAIRRSNPNEPLLTIHDGVIVRANFAATVKDFIRQQFNANGLTPTIRLTPNSKEQRK
ncbi:hypothetical protein OAH18_00540 [bacterium]|nr:hypothetical protein [bacterium]